MRHGVLSAEQEFHAMNDDKPDPKSPPKGSEQEQTEKAQEEAAKDRETERGYQ